MTSAIWFPIYTQQLANEINNNSNTEAADRFRRWTHRLRILVILAVERMKGPNAARIARLPPDMILAMVQHTTIVPESRYALSGG